MLLTIKCIFIHLVSLPINWVSGMCPYANNQHHQLYETSGNDDHNPDIYDKYMSSLSYETYETDCHNYVSQPPSISDTVIGNALRVASDQAERYVSLDNQLIRESSRSSVPKLQSDMDRNSVYFESATKYVQETTCISKNTTAVYLPTLEFSSDNLYRNVAKVNCANNGKMKNPSCSAKSPYREIDGTCNNLRRPLDARAGDCHRRLLPPDYKDGISQFRTSMDGSQLPNSRLVSTNLLGQDDRRQLSSRFTQLHNFFGEFVISDIGMTLGNNLGMRLYSMQCCDSDDRPRTDHPQCAAIFVPQNNDEMLGQVYPQQKCMEFVRTIPCARCRLGPRMISNSVTAAHDLSPVYGVSTTMLNARRTMVDGCLMSQIVNGEEIFAVERFNASGRYRCFNSECELSPLDVRNVQLPTGQAWALLFHRNHNRHARKLAAIKPYWNDERIFQEARKWNIAEYQHCVYNEYVQTLIGAKLTDYYGILPKPLGQFSEYEPGVELNSILEFQSTAGRHGHSALTEDMLIIEPNSGHEYGINFRQSELFENIFYGEYISGLFLAQMTKPSFETTPSVPFKTFLLNVPGRKFGLDLASLDIQRQRDHGIPGYVNYLKYCHNFDVNSWDDLQHFIDSDKVNKLKKYYKYVEDVELYVGGMYERQVDGGIVGPTYACIIGLQFDNAKYGDRFFYEHGDQIGSFTLSQLNEIKTKTSLASILCKTTDLDQVLADPLRIMSDVNQFVPCSSFDDLDYSRLFFNK